MPIPSSPNGKAILSSLNLCVKHTSATANLMSALVKRWGYLKGKPKNVISIDEWKKAKENAQKAKEVTDNLNKGNWKSLGKGGAAFLKVLDMGLAVAGGFGAVMGIANSEAIKDIVDVNDAVFDSIRLEADKNFALFQKVELRVSGVEKNIEIVNKEVSDSALKAQQAFTNSVAAKEEAYRASINSSNTLARIDNVASNLDSRISPLENSVNSFIGEINKKIRGIDTSVNNLINQIKENAKNNLQNTVKQIQSELTKQKQNLTQQTKQVTNLENQFKKLQQPQQLDEKKVESIAKTAIQATVFPKITEIRTENQILRIDHESLKTAFESTKTVTEIKEEALREQDKILSGAVSAIAKELEKLKKFGLSQDVDPSGQLALEKARALEKQLEKLKQAQQDALKEQMRQAEIIKENEKLNQQGLQALDFLKLSIAQVNTNVNTLNNRVVQIPDQTVRQITPTISPLVGEAICNSARGGCLGNAFNQNANNINAATNAANNALWDKINAGLNALNLAGDAGALGLLNTINDKLGDKIPGGLGKKISDGFKWLQIDRVLNILMLITAIHNAFMLSSSIKDTLLQALGNGLQIIGLKDENGQAFDLNQIINSSVENFVKSIIGEDNYTGLSQNFAKANRIYQATINAANAIQNLTSTVLSALELVGGMTGKIGNALKASGAVMEKAYEWFNPAPNYDNPWMNKLESLDNAANTVLMVTQAPLDVINATTEFNQSTAELIKAVKGEEQDSKSGISSDIPDYKKLKEQQDNSKAQLATPEITLADLGLE